MGVFVAFVDIDALVISEHRVEGEISVETMQEIMGGPARVTEPSPPAPYGHRNNQIHVYDDAGVYWNEHHATPRVREITFVFDLTSAPFVPASCFDGLLRLGSLAVTSDTTASDLLGERRISFERLLPEVIRGKLEQVSITVHLVPGTDRVGCVSVGF